MPSNGDTSQGKFLPSQDSTESTFVDPLIGTMLAGHLEILSCLGSGGMGAVYKAKDLLLKRIVAVKVLRPQTTVGAKNISRFRQEAIATSKLDHPNIIRVYEFHIPDHGQPYLVMDYLDGVTLEELISKNGPIEVRRAISIMTKVCSGLEHAHKAGVIHRDLKPGNVMLVKDENGQQTVKLVDFGIAKVLQLDGEDAHALTMTGELVGSPLYMSPEQCQGRPLDNRSDIYALGCVMYEMLTGKPPFRGATILETIQMQTSSIPKPVNESFPGIKKANRIDAILLKAMAKQPAERFQSVSEFKDAIQTLNQGSGANGWLDWIKLQAELAHNKSTAQKREKFANHSLVLSAILVLAIGAFLYFSYQAQRRHSVDTASNPSAPFLDNRLGASHAGSKTTSSPDEKPEITWRKADLAAQEAVDRGDYKTAKQEYEISYKLSQSIGPEFKLSTLQGLSDFYEIIGDNPTEIYREIERLENQSTNTEMLISALKQEDALKNRESVLLLIDQSYRLSLQLNHQGRFSQSQRLLKTALEIGSHYFKFDDIHLTQCMTSLANASSITDIDSERKLKHAFALAGKHPNSEFLEKSTYLLGRFYNEHNQPELAEKYLMKAHALAGTIHGATSIQVARCSSQIALCYADMGKQDLADTTAHEALSILRSIQPEARDAEAHYLLARLENGLKLKDDVIRDASSSLREFEKSQIKNYPLLAECCHLLASNYPKTSPERIALLLRRRAILKRLKQLTPVIEAQIGYLLWESYMERREFANAKKCLKYSLETVQHWPQGKPIAPVYIANVGHIAMACNRLDQQDEAIKYGLQYRSLVTALYGADSIKAAFANEQLGYYYASANQRGKAIEHLTEFLDFCKNYKPIPAEQELVKEHIVRANMWLSKLPAAEEVQSKSD